MREEIRRYWLSPAILAATIIICDQVSKAWIWDRLGPVEGTSETLIESWLSLTLVKNTGVAFGMFQGIPHFFTITSILISMAAIYFYRYHLPNTRPLIQISLGLVVGGAIGNIIDRIRFGYVIDFVHIDWFPGIFNIADSAITVGVLILAGYLLIFGDAAERKAPADDALLGDLLGQDPPQSGRS
ncbi:MAG TPA: signal peptidase II [Roseiflexaceae bacterium]|nr:signal peptidase II [Roseiflexaceae bacterium]HMP39146.1 signal peptidase II [Roseiflexaceae bacterium]